MLFAVEIEFSNLRSVTADCDVKHRITVFQPVEPPLCGQCLGHKRMEADAVNPIVYTEQHLHCHSQVPRQAP